MKSNFIYGYQACYNIYDKNVDNYYFKSTHALLFSGKLPQGLDIMLSQIPRDNFKQPSPLIFFY